MPATIRDIREKTGLSLATISKCLNGGNVLPENRARIEAAVKELSYEVNELARGLVTHRSRTVGVLVYDIEAMFNGVLLRHIGDALRKNGYGMLICDSSQDETVEADSIRFLLSKKVDGIIVVPVSRNAGFLMPARNADVPVVLLDRILQDEDADSVRIDNRMAVYRAMRLLFEKHHEKIAIICSAVEYTGIERYRGFMETMAEQGFPVPEEYQKKGIHSITHGYNSMKELLELEERPTAVFMTNYEISLGAVMALKEAGLRCPDDISMLGFDDLILSQVLEPKMCTVVQPIKEMGQKAVELLLGRIEKKDGSIPMEIILTTHIQEGNSIRTL